MTIACENSDSIFNEAIRLRNEGLLAEAADAFRSVLSAHPEHLSALVELGNTLYSQALMNDAVEQYRAAIRLYPHVAAVYNNLGIVYQEQGRTDEAIAEYRRALELDPGYTMAHSNLLRCLNFHPAIDNAALFEAHKSFETLHGSLRRPHELSFPNNREPDRQLRIGYVSPDLGNHSVAYFVTSVFPNHDRTRFQVFCYSDRGKEDKSTERIKQGVDVWRRTSGMDDKTLFSLIRNDAIDILVDLAGHTGGNRLPLFAMRPAPVQVTWLGYPNTTGLATMDYRIVDDISDPPGEADRYHSETLLRLPNGFLCFDPPVDAPAVKPLPMLQNGFVTFGSFNALAKITDEAVALWSRILARVPGSRILLKNKCLFDESTRNRLYGQFAVHGISSDRLMMTPYTLTTEEHLDCYSHLDISLDTFPYNGTTTTCESLWMGVPVIGLLGGRHASRVTASILTRLGLDSLVGRDADECVEISVHLAGRHELLEVVRNGLRERMRRSALCDGKGFTRELENAYRNIWMSSIL
ncbi:MAG: tetratricopeptide repeat protein [Geobacteraceae bacterium]|nr:tetratricopeptide repeat protein [Geobacteraceae bacterium]